MARQEQQRLDTDLTEDERETFRALSRERQPRPEIEDAVVASLRTRGHLASRPRSTVARPSSRARWVITGLATAASLVLAFAAGTRVGSNRATAGPPVVPRPRFMLLLYEGSQFENPAPGREGERAAEYSAWARGLRDSRFAWRRRVGRNLAGTDANPLREHAARSRARGPRLLLITARDAGAAAEVARTRPHLKYGGTIAVKPIIAH
jgi:hypothetical protein